MNTLTSDEYQLLKESYSEQLELIKQLHVGRGVETIIPIAERLTGEPIKRNCDECIKEAMMVIAIAFKNYEESQANTPEPKKKVNPIVKTE